MLAAREHVRGEHFRSHLRAGVCDFPERLPDEAIFFAGLLMHMWQYKDAREDYASDQLRSRTGEVAKPQISVRL
jgi:hypothetical protein